MPFDTDDLPDPPDLDLGLDDMKLDTLSGDLRDAMLTRFRQQPRTWAQMSEAEQQDCASGMDLAARDMVRASVRLLTSWEWPRVVVRLGNVTIVPGEKARIEAKISAALYPENLMPLANAAGDSVLLLMVDSATFMGERAPAQMDPDQPDLPDVEAAPQTREEIEADVAAMGQPGYTFPSEEEVKKAYARAVRLRSAGETIVSAGYLASRLSISEDVAHDVMVRLAGAGWISSDQAPASSETDAQPELYIEALEAVRESGKASTSYIQRRFAIGYNAAARIMERLEAQGVVTAPDDQGKRRVIKAPQEPAPAELAPEIADETAAFEAHAADAFEATDAELEKQRTRLAIRERQAAE